MSSEFDSVNPKDVTLGGALEPKQSYPDVTVKLVTRGYQRLGIETPIKKTLMESQMWKIPIRDQTVSKAGGGLQTYRGIEEGNLIGNHSIADIMHDRLEVTDEKSVVEAKRRKPVDIPKQVTIKEKGVAINLANPAEVRLDDLTFDGQKEVLGTSKLLSTPAPTTYSAIDVPPGGYDIKRPRRLTITEGQKRNLMERTAGNYAAYINSRKPRENPFVLREQGTRRTNNNVRLVQRINFNNKYQENLFNTTF